MKNKPLRMITQVSLLVVLGLIIKLLYSPIFTPFGVMVRLNVSNTVTQMIPIIFGPFWGALANAVGDLLAFIIRPQGAWMPHITALEFLSGGLLGLMWRYVRIPRAYMKMLMLVLITDVVYTALNTIGLLLFIPSMQGVTFMAAVTPRFIVTVAVAIPKAYIMMILLNLYNKYIKAN